MRWPELFSRVLDALAALKIGIFLLALIAAASIVGWLTPQGQNVEFPADTPQWLHGLDSYLPLNDIFHSRWFVLLLALLTLNLAAGALRRVPAAWRQRGRTAVRRDPQWQ
jgi:cytochrome c biogenesis protein